jgi:hypothetical protein
MPSCGLIQRFSGPHFVLAVLSLVFGMMVMIHSDD